MISFILSQHDLLTIVQPHAILWTKHFTNIHTTAKREMTVGNLHTRHPLWSTVRLFKLKHDNPHIVRASPHLVTCLTAYRNILHCNPPPMTP